jgi:hypothetical protein
MMALACGANREVRVGGANRVRGFVGARLAAPDLALGGKAGTWRAGYMYDSAAQGSLPAAVGE